LDSIPLNPATNVKHTNNGLMITCILITVYIPSALWIHINFIVWWGAKLCNTCPESK